MRPAFVFVFALFICTVCVAQRHRTPEPFPTEVVIGRDSFIDIGPPFNYYDLTFLRSDGEKTDVERVSLTPPSNACYPRAEIEVDRITLNETLSSLLQGTNPCAIPEKKLNAELKRRKKGLVFSGMNVSIQVQCDGKVRLIRADILDRDIFGDQTRTPQYTSWSRTLFAKLDKATGQSPWDKPVFPVAESASAAPPTSQSDALQAIADGKFDGIFGDTFGQFPGDTSDRPSALYRLAQNVPRQPLIELTKSDPVRPAAYVDPVYPPIAKAARVQGTVEFHLSIGIDGSAENIAIDSGPRMLWQAVNDASAKWKFSPDNSGKTVHGSVRFGLNCASESK
jgi:Gram-negative bacterial TonB protein C-terminal